MENTEESIMVELDSAEKIIDDYIGGTLPYPPLTNQGIVMGMMLMLDTVISDAIDGSSLKKVVKEKLNKRVAVIAQKSASVIDDL